MGDLGCRSGSVWDNRAHTFLVKDADAAKSETASLVVDVLDLEAPYARNNIH